MLEKRKSAFGFNMISFTLMETRNIALGGIWFGQQKNKSLLEVLWKVEVTWEMLLMLLLLKCNGRWWK